MQSLNDNPSVASAASAADPAATDQFDQPFPTAALPSAIRDIIETVSEVNRVPHALPACCALSAISAAIGSGLRIKSVGAQETRGNIYIAAGVPSGSGKTQVFNAILKPIFDQQEWLSKEFERDEAKRRIRLMDLDEDIRELKGLIAKCKASGEDAYPLKEKLMKTLDRQKKIKELSPISIYCDDATGPALERLLSRNPLLSASDEAGDAILGNLLGRFGRGTDESIYVRAFSGGNHGGTHRIGRPTVKLTDPCLTVIWLMQPNKLDKLYSQSVFREDGLLARILPCRIDMEPQKRQLRAAELGAEQALKRDAKAWDKLWRALHNQYHPVYRPKTFAPFVLDPPDDEEQLIEYHNRTVDLRRKELAHMQCFPARWAEQAWRLSVVLHAAEHGDKAHDRPVRCVGKAIKIIEWFAAHQLALVKQSQASLAEERERKVVGLIKQQSSKGEDWVNERHLVSHRIVPSSLEAKQLLRRMEQNSQLIREERPPERGGHTEVRYRLRQP